MPQINKPYVWLNNNGGTPEISFMVSCTSSYGIKFFDRRTQEDTYFIFYKIDSTVPSQAIYNYVLDQASGYNNAIHDKVTLVILNPDESVAGSASIMPGADTFDLGTNPVCLPYSYIKFNATDDMVVHFMVKADKAISFAEQLPDDTIPNQRTVKYKMTGSPIGVTKIHELNHQLNDSTHYDPVIDTIMISLVETDGGGNERRKGTGTVHSSEGDASSDV